MPNQCANCNAPVEPGLMACPACGTPVNPAATSIAPLAPTISNPNETHSVAIFMALALPVFAAAFIAIVIGGVAFLIFHFGHFNKPRPTPSPTPVVIAPKPPLPKPSPRTLPPTSRPTAVRVTAPPPPPVSVKPARPAPAPVLTGFFPATAGPGTTLTLQGTGLKGVTQVMMIGANSAREMDAKIVAATDSVVAVQVPDIPYDDQGIVIAVVSPGGVAALFDQHTGVTPWGTDGRLLMTAVHVMPGDQIETSSGMVMQADTHSTVSVGDNSIAFLADHVTVTQHGRNCTIFYVAPITLGDGVSKEGLIEVRAVHVADPTDLFRVKSAAAGGNQ